MRMVATDLDGTVLHPDGSVSPRTLAAFAACQASGVRVVFVTGRPPRWMPSVAAVTGHLGTAICGNGAVLYDLGRDRVVSARTMTPDVLTQAVTALREVVPGAVFAVETVSGFWREPDFIPQTDVASASRVEDVDALLAAQPEVVKLLCRLRGVRAGTGELLADEMLARARPVLAGIAEPVHSNAADSMLEIAALGVSKASTLADLVALDGLGPADVVAFGDMPNDIPMLRWAGRGYAMSDGHPDAIAAADHVAPPCVQDGVAQVIEQLLAAR